MTQYPVWVSYTWSCILHLLSRWYESVLQEIRRRPPGGHHTGDIYRTRPVAYHTTSTDMSWHTGHMIISDYIPTLVCRGIGWCAVWNHLIRRVALRVRASHISDNQTRCGVHHGHDGEAYHTRTRTHIVAITSPWQGKKKWHRLSFHRIHVLSMTHNEITLS